MGLNFKNSSVLNHDSWSVKPSNSMSSSSSPNRSIVTVNIWNGVFFVSNGPLSCQTCCWYHKRNAFWRSAGLCWRSLYPTSILMCWGVGGLYMQPFIFYESRCSNIFSGTAWIGCWRIYPETVVWKYISLVLLQAYDFGLT